MMLSSSQTNSAISGSERRTRPAFLRRSLVRIEAKSWPIGVSPQASTRYSTASLVNLFSRAEKVISADLVIGNCPVAQ